ncbi:MAG: DUF6774 domain-containing protein [Lachnospiraceae bacterium]
MNDCCSSLFFLSAVACRLTDCLEEDELTILAADLMTLSDMITALLARQSACKNDPAGTNTGST